MRSWVLPVLLFLAAYHGGVAAPLSTDLVVPKTLAGVTFQEVKVRLVLLQATVTNPRGEIVRNLGPGDFRIQEDGVNQEITVFGRASDHPLEIAFLLDISGSMGVHGKLDRARAAIQQFVDALRPEDRTALLVFADGDVVVRVPFTTDRLAFLEVLDVQEAWGRTALRDALAHASGVLADSGPGRKALVLVTDGVDNASQRTAFAAIRLAREVRVPIYALGLTGLPEKLRRRAAPPGGGRTFLEILAQVSQETGGASFPVFDVADVEAAVNQVQERLRTQYVLGYNPVQDVESAGYRRIRVVAGEGRFQVHTRSGYYAKP
ncbi:MAG: VWA domain-containing protein [Acidobacteria bacterium]|nr:VWA domain-containing protein [Acidobacteriota bacterium]